MKQRKPNSTVCEWDNWVEVLDMVFCFRIQRVWFSVGELIEFWRCRISVGVERDEAMWLDLPMSISVLWASVWVWFDDVDSGTWGKSDAQARFGSAGFRTRVLSHAKRALYHWATPPHVRSTFIHYTSHFTQSIHVHIPTHQHSHTHTRINPYVSQSISNQSTITQLPRHSTTHSPPITHPPNLPLTSTFTRAHTCTHAHTRTRTHNTNKHKLTTVNSHPKLIHWLRSNDSQYIRFNL